MKEIVLPENESELTELLHVIFGVGFPTAEQFMAKKAPSLTVYALTFGEIVTDWGLTEKEEPLIILNFNIIDSKLILFTVYNQLTKIKQIIFE